MKEQNNKKAKALARIIAKRQGIDEKKAYRKLAARLPKLGKLFVNGTYNEYSDALVKAVKDFSLGGSDSYKLMVTVNEWVASRKPDDWRKIMAERVA